MPSKVKFYENEISVVHIVDRLLDSQDANILFYQAADYCRFRAEYRAYKENEIRAHRMRRFNEMTQEARYEMQIQEQIKFIMNLSSVSRCPSSKLSEFPTIPARTAFPTQPPKSLQGIAGMA